MNAHGFHFEKASPATGLVALVVGVILLSAWVNGTLRGGELLPVLTTSDQVRRLPLDQAAKAYPVRLRGVISYRARAHSLMFVQDATGGIYVRPDLFPDHVKDLGAGTELELEGVTSAGRFAPQVEGRAGRPVGAGQMPEASWLAPDQLGDPWNHSQWVELGGVVRSTQVRRSEQELLSEAILGVGTGAGRFSVVIYGPEAMDAGLTNLVGALVRARGVYGSVFNERRQLVGVRLFVNSSRDLMVEKPGGGDPFGLAARSIASLMQFEATPEAPARVHVKGIVTLATEEGVFLEDESGGVKVLADDSPALRTGVIAHVSGFPAWGDWSPVLEDAQFRVQGPGTLPSAPLIEVREARRGHFCFRRVRLEALVLQTPRHAQQPSLVLQAGGEIFLARLAGAFDPASVRIREGSWVQLAGICINQSRPEGTPPTARPSQGQERNPAPFHLLLAAPSDVAVIRAPSWWTMPRLLGTVAGLGAVLIGSLVWAALLRRQVAAQTRIIRERLAYETVIEERTRIARELHDTLEQEMTGIAMQLDAAGAMIENLPEKAHQAIHTARALLDRSRAESRRSIWELRSTALEAGGLVAVFQELVRSAPEGQAPLIDFSTEGAPRRLPARIETHLFRIGHEAITNALKHAEARRISVHLAFAQGEVSVRVKDDGRGFVVDTPASRHFGLLGMKERAAKIQARLEIRSGPGQGAEIIATALEEAPKPAVS